MVVTTASWTCWMRLEPNTWRSWVEIGMIEESRAPMKVSWQLIGLSSIIMSVNPSSYNINLSRRYRMIVLTFSLDDHPPDHLTAFKLHFHSAHMNLYCAPPHRKQCVMNFPFLPFITPDLSIISSIKLSKPEWLVGSPNLSKYVDKIAGKM